MSFIEIFMLALALSVDACVVSFSYSLLELKSPNKTAFMLALTTGFFQALMPVIGYILTSFAFQYISPYSKYIVFTIFTILGMKFIIESFSDKKEKSVCIGWVCLLMIGIGTSIDAFSGGISLKLSGNGILYPALLIGIVTFVNSIIGFKTGKYIKHMPVMYLEILSGTILILLGLKALI